MSFRLLFHPHLGLQLSAEAGDLRRGFLGGRIFWPRKRGPLPAHVARQRLNPRLLAVHMAAAGKPRGDALWADGR